MKRGIMDHCYVALAAMCAIAGVVASAEGIILHNKLCMMNGCNTTGDQRCVGGNGADCSYCSGSPGIWDHTCVNSDEVTCTTEAGYVSCGTIMKGTCEDLWCRNAVNTSETCLQSRCSG